MTIPRHRLDLTSCHLLAAVADCLRLAGKDLLQGGVEGSVGVALSQERIRLTDEMLRWCADLSGFLAEGELTDEQREALDRAVKDTTERAQKARAFYANLLAWIEFGRKQPVPPLDEPRRDGAKRFSSAEVLRELPTAAPVDLSMPVADDFAVTRALKAPEAVREPAGQREFSSVAGLTLREAECLLDCLQNQGCTGLEAAPGEGGVTVRYVCPPGLRLVRDEGGAVCLAWG